MAGGNKVIEAKLKGDILRLPVLASVEIYRGQMVSVDANGWAIPAADTASTFFAGIAEERVTGGATNGLTFVKVRRKGLFKMKMAATGAALAAPVATGEIVYVDTPHTSAVDELVDIAAGVTNHIMVGVIVKHGTDAEAIAGTVDTSIWVDILGISATAYSATFLTAATLASYVAGSGAQKVGVEDASGYGTSKTLQDALEAIVALGSFPIPLNTFTLEDGTALTTWGAGAVPGFQQISNKDIALTWDGNGTPGAVAVTACLPRDIDTTADLVIHFLAAMAGASDTPVLVFEAFFSDPTTNTTIGGDTDCAGTDPEVTGAAVVTEYTMTIAAANIPVHPAALTMVITPTAGQMDTDECRVVTMWGEYTKTFA